MANPTGTLAAAVLVLAAGIPLAPAASAAPAEAVATVAVFGGAHTVDMTRLFNQINVNTVVRPLSQLGSTSLDGVDAVLVTADGYPSRPTQLGGAAATNLARFMDQGKRVYVEFATGDTGAMVQSAVSPVLATFPRVYVSGDSAFGNGLGNNAILDEHNSYYLPMSAPEGSSVPLSYGTVAGVGTAVFGPSADARPALIVADHGPGQLFYATSAMSNYLQGRYVLSARWQQLWVNIAVQLLPDSVRGKALRAYAPIKAYTTPRVWAEPNTPVTLNIESPRDQSLVVTLDGQPLPAPRSAANGALAAPQVSLAPGTHLFTVRAQNSISATTVPITVQHRDQAYRSMLAKAVDWYQRSGVMLGRGDGSAAVAEGFSSEIGPDGRNPFKPDIRGDGVTETAYAFQLYGQLTGNRQYTNTASNIMDQVYGRMQIPTQDALYGLFETRGYWPGAHTPEEYVFRDDEGWISLLTQVYAQIVPNDRHMVQALRSVESLNRTARADGIQPYVGPGTDMLGVSWDFIAHLAVSPQFGSDPHYQSMAAAALFYAYATTGAEKYLRTALNSVDFFLSQLPNIGMEKSRSEEYGRALLVLAAAYHYTGNGKYYRVLSDFASFYARLQDPATGAIPEWDGVNPRSNEDYGTYESTVIQQNGDKVTDQLYTTGFLAMNLWIAYKATGIGTFRALDLNLIDYLSRIQIQSADPTLNGTWMRAFDYGNWEYYGSGADVGWGPYAVETGWTNAPIMIGTLLYLLDQSFWPSPVAARDADVRRVTGEFDEIAKTLPSPQYGELFNSPVLNRPDKAFTLEAWIRPDQRTVDKRYVGLVSKTTSSLWLRGGHLYGEFLTTSGNWITVQSQATVPANAWTHTAVTYDGNTLALWINGAKTEEVPAVGLSVQRTGEPLAVGAHNPQYLGQGYFFGGQIDEVRSSDIARTWEGVPTGPYTPDGNTLALLHFDEQGNPIIDSSGNGLVGDLVGGPRWTESGRFGGGLSLSPNPSAPNQRDAGHRGSGRAALTGGR
ncbi:hypothetical protein GCM10010174_31320 [Kutzneria viridogrisea]|uniref:LamG-like jellyroll fold domain-containing protein n=1 Tax=Kutzneria viridogrisea TaxID=47990 RepID=A0ABR6BR26_9PSEU|nr:hypothetical protein [Kutzneria viridogrisea]